MSYLDTIRQIERNTLPDLHPVTPDWLAAWRELARLSDGITPDDARFQSVLTALARCDVAFIAGAWNRFQRAAEQVKQVVGRG